MIYDLPIPESFKNDPILLFIRRIIETKYDGRKKIVGDRVIVWDQSACFDEKNNQIFHGEPFLSEKMIVIDTGDIGYQPIEIIPAKGIIYDMPIDLVLYEPTTKRKIKTNGDFCKIIE